MAAVAIHLGDTIQYPRRAAAEPRYPHHLRLPHEGDATTFGPFNRVCGTCDVSPSRPYQKTLSTTFRADLIGLKVSPIESGKEIS